ncbi:MAG TPA: hydantoinase/oxoprolinase family protein [Thermohalobaculum sp.]|nr:hydantoinase/oxoprolinase family protein [Thermohalobaculum sp.]
MTWSIGVDAGGTFTDFFARETVTGRVVRHKRPSTPDDPSRAILDGLEELAAKGGIDLGQVDRLGHGTTVGTNALIQRRGGRVAMITTKGFRDLLEIGRQTRPHMFDLQRDAPPPVVPRERRFELAERVTATGAVLTAPIEADIDALVEMVHDSGAEAVAVCFLFSFLNPEHERRVGAAVEAALPDVQVSLSSAVRPEFREYERFTTTAINAYLQPVMDRYVSKLHTGLATRAPNAAVGINQSNGGLMAPETARRYPVRTALSGPAAGVVGAIHEAKVSGRPNVITIDVGGTSADMALIRNGAADISFERAVADFPIRLPMIDIHTIGAGGGSIAWFDRDGLLKVGPDSAGAQPGPACYGRGGTKPTVSDANLVLGRLGPELVDGGMMMDLAAARAALAPVAANLGITIERAAFGIIEIVTANMVRAIRTISIERGYDPRAFSLMPFGGAGPLHAREIAIALSMREILVPGAPGVLCAEGLLVADQKEDFVRSRRLALTEPAMPQLLADAAALLDEADDWFRTEAITQPRRALEMALDCRYVGQNFELRVPLACGPTLTASALPPLDQIKAGFFAAHRTAYGYATEAEPVEAINLRLTALGRAEMAREAPPGDATATPEPKNHRQVWFTADQPMNTPIYRRCDLVRGTVITGPAIVDQLDATTPIHPSDIATVDPAGNLLIEMRT